MGTAPGVERRGTRTDNNTKTEERKTRKK